MQHLGTNSPKQIRYTTAAEDLAALAETNWMALVLADKYMPKAHDQVMETIISRQPLFVHCCCSNFSDMEDAVADLLCEAYPGFDDDTVMPMSFGDSDLLSSLRFCIFDAFHETMEIKEVVVIDLREAAKPDEVQLALAALV